MASGRRHFPAVNNGINAFPKTLTKHRVVSATCARTFDVFRDKNTLNVLCFQCPSRLDSVRLIARTLLCATSRHLLLTACKIILFIRFSSTLFIYVIIFLIQKSLPLLHILFLSLALSCSLALSPLSLQLPPSLPPSLSALYLGESSPAHSESHYRLQAQLQPMCVRVCLCVCVRVHVRV